ncbi:MAG: KH domain-containing protein [Deltaproteobacteria bacterium]|nr:MAG: KH domain-containing protein [Deltaproteobacteria bacterium]
MGIAADIRVHEEADRVRLEIVCDEPDRLVGRKGQTLDALQHLVGKIVFRGRTLGQAGAPQRPIVVDAGGYRDRHAARLRELAAKLAEQALARGRPVAVEPMSAHDRRIMHMALADVAGVTTRSEGEGDERHMWIVPVAQE